MISCNEYVLQRLLCYQNQFLIYLRYKSLISLWNKEVALSKAIKKSKPVVHEPIFRFVSRMISCMRIIVSFTTEY